MAKSKAIAAKRKSKVRSDSGSNIGSAKGSAGGKTGFWTSASALKKGAIVAALLSFVMLFSMFAAPALQQEGESYGDPMLGVNPFGYDPTNPRIVVDHSSSSSFFQLRSGYVYNIQIAGAAGQTGTNGSFNGQKEFKGGDGALLDVWVDLRDPSVYGPKGTLIECAYVMVAGGDRGVVGNQSHAEAGIGGSSMYLIVHFPSTLPSYTNGDRLMLVAGGGGGGGARGSTAAPPFNAYGGNAGWGQGTNTSGINTTINGTRVVGTSYGGMAGANGTDPNAGGKPGTNVPGAGGTPTGGAKAGYPGKMWYDVPGPIGGQGGDGNPTGGGGGGAGYAGGGGAAGGNTAMGGGSDTVAAGGGGSSFAATNNPDWAVDTMGANTLYPNQAWIHVVEYGAANVSGKVTYDEPTTPGFVPYGLAGVEIAYELRSSTNVLLDSGTILTAGDGSYKLEALKGDKNAVMSIKSVTRYAYVLTSGTPNSVPIPVPTGHNFTMNGPHAQSYVMGPAPNSYKIYGNATVYDPFLNNWTGGWDGVYDVQIKYNIYSGATLVHSNSTYTGLIPSAPTGYYEIRAFNGDRVVTAANEVTKFGYRVLSSTNPLPFSHTFTGADVQQNYIMEYTGDRYTVTGNVVRSNPYPFIGLTPLYDVTVEYRIYTTPTTWTSSFTKTDLFGNYTIEAPSGSMVVITDVVKHNFHLTKVPPVSPIPPTGWHYRMFDNHENVNFEMAATPPFFTVTGVVMDRTNPANVVPLGGAIIAYMVGSEVQFASSQPTGAYAGRYWLNAFRDETITIISVMHEGYR
ncbi:MAG: hypothetical protein LBI08_04210, partial [Methanomassiliicoccaceae archaeon]|nr:hypothetical protein [Methanomassiliicoccaceae archaeon]